MNAKVIPFNPLDTKNLGASVAEAMLGGPIRPLGGLAPFPGAGIYAIYYTGDFAPYAEIATRNAEGRFAVPIYVGKAVHAGSRKGGSSVSKSPPVSAKPLFNRLMEHAESVQAARNLSLEHFHCRFLVVDDIWIPLGESLLIARYSPLWNSLVEGFGNHDPGRGRYEGLRPRWDTLHPGRGWAERCRERDEAPADIERDVASYLRATTFPTSNRFLMETTSTEDQTPVAASDSGA